MLDFCELNPSPAARVALAAVRRWGASRRPRARRHPGAPGRGRSHCVPCGNAPQDRGPGAFDRASRHALCDGPSAVRPGSPRLWSGARDRALSADRWGCAGHPRPADDGLAGRVEELTGAPHRVGIETIDAIALSTPLESRRGDLRLSTATTLRGSTRHAQNPASPSPARPNTNPASTDRRHHARITIMTGLNLETFLNVLRADLWVWTSMAVVVFGVALLAWTSWGARLRLAEMPRALGRAPPGSRPLRQHGPRRSGASFSPGTV